MNRMSKTELVAFNAKMDPIGTYSHRQAGKGNKASFNAGNQLQDPKRQ